VSLILYRRYEVQIMCEDPKKQLAVPFAHLGWGEQYPLDLLPILSISPQSSLFPPPYPLYTRFFVYSPFSSPSVLLARSLT
jgi:hypothetical protein